MQNFIYHNPTRLVFGRGQIASLAELIPDGKKIMLTFGGGSVRKNGVYDEVAAALKDRDYVEFWGIEPNPSVETVREAVALARENGVEFLLAVGGGSVLDATKLIASALAMPGTDPWQIVRKGTADGAIPYACVMTLPATGSEMNNGSVISCKQTQEKYPFHTRFPEFSVLDPQVTYMLPPAQIANGLTDIFVHVTEQYMTTSGQSRLMDRWAEGLLLTLIEIAPKIRQNQRDYDLMADYMLAAALALNDMISMGVAQDWATHMIGHELTALTGIAHGASLAIAYPATLRVLRDQKRSKLLQYAERIWNITDGSEDERIDRAIARTEDFFRSLGQATRLSEAGIGDETIDRIAERFNRSGAAFGEQGNVTGEVARQILSAAK